MLLCMLFSAEVGIERLWIAVSLDYRQTHTLTNINTVPPRLRQLFILDKGDISAFCCSVSPAGHYLPYRQFFPEYLSSH